MVTPPLTSQDVFWNLFQGRIFSHYRQNPYLIAPQNFLGGPFFKTDSKLAKCSYGLWPNLDPFGLNDFLSLSK